VLLFDRFGGDEVVGGDGVLFRGIGVHYYFPGVVFICEEYGEFAVVGFGLGVGLGDGCFVYTDFEGLCRIGDPLDEAKLYGLCDVALACFLVVIVGVLFVLVECVYDF